MNRVVEGRRKKAEGRGRKEEGRRRRAEGRGRKEGGRGQEEEGKGLLPCCDRSIGSNLLGDSDRWETEIA
jgi:hypothetical protein